jgi:hypothetical protein
MGLLLVVCAAGCTAAGEYEPNRISSSGAGGVAGTGGPVVTEQAPAAGGTSPAPVLDPGEAEPPASLLPSDTAEDNAGTSRSGADIEVVQDAGSDAGDAGDAGVQDAGPAATDASAAGEPDATPSGLDASTPPSEPDASPPPAPCPGLVFEGSCYEFFGEVVSWTTAEQRCIDWGGHLASVESLEEDAFIGAWPALLGIGALDGSGLWLGGTDALSDGDFRWWDDRPLGYAGWAGDQPNNGQGVDCIEKRNDATQRWYDRRCTDGERYVCERAE